eukprot:scaffold15482_cov25-Prasinocladus_malaysianus.AAC.1
MRPSKRHKNWRDAGRDMTRTRLVGCIARRGRGAQTGVVCAALQDPHHALAALVQPLVQSRVQIAVPYDAPTQKLVPQPTSAPAVICLPWLRRLFSKRCPSRRLPDTYGALHGCNSNYNFA